MKTIGILLLFTGFLFLNSCSKEDTGVKPQKDLADQVGYWHNEAVAAVMNNPEFNRAVESGSLTGPFIRELIMMELSKRESNVFDYETTRLDLSWSDQTLVDKGIMTGAFSTNVRRSGAPAIDTEAVFKYLFQKKEIGSELYATFIQLNKKVISNNVSRAEIIKLSRQMKDLPLSDEEKSYVDVFNQVLYASNNYWENTHARMQDKKTLGVIWADAAGGLYGMLCGPVCSIIEAAVFSTIVAIQE